MQLHSAIKTLVDSQQYQQALQLFHQQSCISIDGTITLALKASAAIRDHEGGIRIHQQLSRKSLANPWIQSSLVYFYGKIVNFHLSHGVSFVSIVRCNDVTNAEKMFSTIEKKTVFVYGSMFKGRALSLGFNCDDHRVWIVGYLSDGKPEKVMEEFKKMTIEPDEGIVNMFLIACGKCIDAGSMEVAKEVMKTVPFRYFASEKVVRSAIDMLMKFGEVTKAEELFQSIKDKDLITYGNIMNGHRCY